MRVSVFGLGYVGCVSAACLAKEGHTVVGVDVTSSKVDAVNRGEATILEERIGGLVKETVRAGQLRATADAAEAVRHTDLSLICVGTPSRRNGSLDLTFVRRVAEEIGRAVSEKLDPHTVVLRSTVLPGTLEDVVIPTLERSSGRELGAGFDACVNPEFLREGTSVRDFYEPPFTLIGAATERAAQQLEALYEGIDAPLLRVDVRTAEMVKYACNAFHALKVSFANEIGRICRAFGIDSHRVMKVVCTDTKLNISPAYLRPGFAFGGSCLPKDLRALTHAARRHDLQVPVLEATLETNRRQIEQAAQMVLDAGHRSVGILGLSFKEGTNDLRESPMVALVEILLGKGLDLRIYDRHVTQASLIGANRTFIETHIPHIWSLMCDSRGEVLQHADTLVLGTWSTEFASLLQERRNGQVIIDLVRLADRTTDDEEGYQGICW
ncbi:MAG: nucleotide sugar dehydrogenase [Gemmatimonadota bacterium]